MKNKFGIIFVICLWICLVNIAYGAEDIAIKQDKIWNTINTVYDLGRSGSTSNNINDQVSDTYSNNGILKYSKGVNIGGTVIQMDMKEKVQEVTLGNSNFLGNIPRWIITGSVLYGHKDVGLALDVISKNVEEKVSIRFEEDKLRYIKEYRRLSFKDENEPIEVNENGIVVNVPAPYPPYQLSDPASKDIMAIRALQTLSMSALAMPMFNGDTSLYQIMLYISAGIIILASATRSGFMIYENVVNGRMSEAESLSDMFYIGLIKPILLLSFLSMLLPIMEWSIEISAQIYDIMIATTASSASATHEITDIMEISSQLIRDRATLAANSLGDSAGWLMGATNWVVSLTTGYNLEQMIVMIATHIASAIFWVMMILMDVVGAITVILGPLAIAMSLFPKCSSWLESWIKGFVALLFWQPLAIIFAILLIILCGVIPDNGIPAFLVLIFAYILSVIQIPTLSKDIANGSITGVAEQAAEMPGKAAAGIAMTSAGAIGGLVSKGAKGLAGVAGKFVGS